MRIKILPTCLRGNYRDNLGELSGSYGKPEVTNSGSVISCASCVTSHSMRSAELERVAIFCDSPARGATQCKTGCESLRVL